MKKRIFALSLCLSLIMLAQTVFAYSNYGVLTNLSTSGDVTCNVGSSASFSVTATYTQGSASDLRYEWYFIPNIPGHNGNRLSDGNGISGSSTSNLRVTASTEREGSYYAIVRMFDEALNSDTMRLTVIEPTPNNPRPSETPSNNQTPNAPPSNNQTPSYPSNNQTPNAPSNNQSQPTRNTALPEMPNPRITTSEDSICVDWLQVKAGDGYAMNYGIRIDNKPHENVFFTPYGSNIHYFRGLTAGTDYTIELWGENAQGDKGPSFIKTVKTWGTAPASSTPAAAGTTPTTPSAPTSTATGTTPTTTAPSTPASSTVKPAGTLPPASAAALPFTDVAGDAWYYNSVKFVYDAGIIKGTSATTYEPLKSISRAEAITLAASMHQRYVNGSVTIAAGSDKWYSNFVTYAIDNGIFTMPDFTYSAITAEQYFAEPISRATFVSYFAYALPEGALTATHYGVGGPTPDVDIEHFAYREVNLMKSWGIVSGVDAAGNFKPDLQINRAEVAVIVERMLKNAYGIK